MKKRITAVVTLFALVLCLQTFVFANATVTVSDANEYKTANLSGNNLNFSAKITGASGITFSVPEKVLTAFYNDPQIRFYTFSFNDLTVRTDKNNFYDFRLSGADFTLTNRSFSVTYKYKDGVSTKRPASVNLDMTYTLSGTKFSEHTVAIMSGKTVFCKEHTPEKFVFETNLLGSFTPQMFEFSDVRDKNAWYYSHVNGAGAYGIVTGVGDGSFRPLQNVTRCELATLIVQATDHLFTYRENENFSFTDVKKDTWYYKFVNMCAAKGLVSGIGEGKFNPLGFATRQEVAQIAANFITKLGTYGGKPLPKIDDKKVDAELAAAFKDASTIAPWARKGVLLCYKLGIMKGDAGCFSPLRNITRAESATLFNSLHFKAV